MAFLRLVKCRETSDIRDKFSKHVLPWLPVKVDIENSTWRVSGACYICTDDSYLAPEDIIKLYRRFPYRTRLRFSFTGIRIYEGRLVLSFVWNE